MISKFVALLLLSVPAFSSPGAPLCGPASKFSTITLSFDQLQIIVSSRKNENDPEACRFRVVARNGSAVINGSDMGILQPQYVDLDSDGIPELIVATDSGGSGGYHTSYVFSQNPRPRLVGKIVDAGPLRVVYGAHGNGYALQTEDLAFSSFEGLCNACSPHTVMYLKLERGRLVDDSARFAYEYDREIAELKRAISREDLKAFLAVTHPGDTFYLASFPAMQLCLKITLDYLYSGREKEARATLESMWPFFDRERIWKEIVKTRQSGIVEQIAK